MDDLKMTVEAIRAEYQTIGRGHDVVALLERLDRILTVLPDGKDVTLPLVAAVCGAFWDRAVQADVAGHPIFAVHLRRTESVLFEFIAD